MTVALTATGCGSGGAAGPVADEAAVEAVALQAVGFTEEAGPEPSKGAGDRPRLIRRELRKNTLHGEVTVRTKDGDRTVVVQRGTITAVTGSGLTVKSADGFELTWSYGDPLRIVRAGQKLERDALEAGAEVGLGGLRAGPAVTARLIRVK